MKRNFIIPKPDNVVIGIDFGQGDDVATKVILKKVGKGLTEIVSIEKIGTAKDFDTEEKIDKYIEKL